MKLTLKQTQAIATYFKTQPVLRAYLFGSYVRGEANADSDVDILVDLDYSQPIGLEFVQMKLDLQDILSKNVDLVSSRALSKYIKHIVESEKKMIYAR
ncbi:MAG: nucleotidyltransferase domain-containing protein [Bacteroidia bacterium]|nr:nucleotidyltransferase domain-containing protein [Bacteroidia bacterium]